MNNLVFVICDGIRHSVFSGQVLQPLIKKAQNNPNLKIYLISFESIFEKISSNSFQKIEYEIKTNLSNNIELKIFRRLPFLGKISLYFQVFQLKNFLFSLKNYEIIARGPLSGWIVLKSITNNCRNFIVQARGLLAQEYYFTFKDKNFFHKWRKNKLEKIESEIYATQNIEAVTEALKEYLIEHFKSDEIKIKIAVDDIVEKIPEAQIKLWRSEYRKKLNISENQHVYCYSGAIKAWQQPELVINFFKNKLDENFFKNSDDLFLLILTTDVEEFKKLIDQKIEKKYYKILTIDHNDIYKYLSACDTGLVFREKHILSWVSRPVKAIEYKAVSLKIAHNNTVRWLNDN